MDTEERRENEAFENEVRRIARELWPSAAHSGAAIIGGKEHDGIFETEECIHLVEATTSRKMDKAQVDVGKLYALASKIQKKNPSKAVKGWFVTRDEPTADQRRVADKRSTFVIALSYSHFQSKLIDSHAYLAARANYPFGSVRDPETGENSPRVEYIPLDLVAIDYKTLKTVDELITEVTKGRRFVILGDYGAGKSMTLRHLYSQLRKDHFTGNTPSFPVYLNLRDHFGQTDPSEILERHAKAIGFSHPYHLVRAWRAGYVILLLDGFDEVTTIGIQGLWRKLKDNRYRAMEAVRHFVREHPHRTGIVISGRTHFFDSDLERRHALEISDNFLELSLTEFTDEQIQKYFEKSGLEGKIPQWLPSRPLLVGYLAAKGLISELSKVDSSDSLDPAIGWDRLLDAIADREAKIEAGIDGRTVRRILERLATRARAAEGGVGPLTMDDIVTAFKDICGYNPDDRGMVLLQRLPGLGIDRPDEETRAFIDKDFADVCRAGDLVEFIEHPYDHGPVVFQATEC
jgi:NACHT domain